MSYWIYLVDHNDETVTVETHSEGGNYVVGGTNEACINVTYNYGKHIWPALGQGGLRTLDGKRARDTIDALAAAVEQLGTERSDDYWAATPGNAGYTLNILLAWAQQHPDAIWVVH